ncbi:MAG: trehalase family glycosidase, partial [Bacteroidota bacterium]
ELDTLFKGQWENGMVPHILFHSENETTYFPNYDFWNSNVNQGAPQKPKSSGITQPPVHGFILENLLEKFPDNEELLAFAKDIFPKIVHFHRFLYTYRDPNQEGLFFIYHPWESGRDNSPLWDESLDRIQIDRSKLPTYKRKDTSLADSSERPTDDQYDRYVYLIQFGKENQYDGKAIAKESPVLIQDSMMNAILIKSNQSLINLADKLGMDKGELEEWQQQSIKSYNDKLWSDELGMYACYDMRGGKQIAFKEIGGISPIYAGIPDKQKADLLAKYLQDLHDRGYYLCPSFDVDSPLFDSKRYWRGPVWPQMNWMLHMGLKEYGYEELAEIMKSDLLELVRDLGFHEYFEPEKSLAKKLSKGYGGDSFSWTASSVLDLIHST